MNWEQLPFLAIDDGGGGTAAVETTEAADTGPGQTGGGSPPVDAAVTPGGPATVGGDSDADDMARMAKSVLEQMAAKPAEPGDSPRGTSPDPAAEQAKAAEVAAQQTAQQTASVPTRSVAGEQQPLHPEVAQYLASKGYGNHIGRTDSALLMDLARRIRQEELTMTGATAATLEQQQTAARAYQVRLEQLNEAEQTTRQQAAFRQFFGEGPHVQYLLNPNYTRAQFPEGDDGDRQFAVYKAIHKFDGDFQQLDQAVNQRFQGMGQQNEQRFAEQQKVIDELRQQFQGIQKIEHERMLEGVKLDLVTALDLVEKDFPDIFNDPEKLNLLATNAGASMSVGRDYTRVFPNMSRMEAALRYHAQSLGYDGLRARERTVLTDKLRSNAASSSAHRADSRVAASRGPETFREITAETLEKMRRQGIDVPEIPAEFLRDDPDRPD